MSNHMIENAQSAVRKAQRNLIQAETYDYNARRITLAAISALKETGPNSFISEIINRYAGLHPMDEHGRKLWNNLIDAVLNMKEKT